MSIQSSINQTLSIAGFLYSQTPAYQQQAKITGLQKEQKALQQRKQVAVEVEGGSPAAIADLEEEMAKVQHDIYKTKPSAAAYKAYEEQAGIAREASAAKHAQLEEEARQQAIDEENARLAAETPTEDWVEVPTPAKKPSLLMRAGKASMDFFSFADKQLQKAIAAKNELTRRKGGKGR